MILLKNSQRKIKIPEHMIRSRVAAILRALMYNDYDIGIWITTDTTIRTYNWTYRKKNRPTDILSFPYHPTMRPGKRIIPVNPEDKNLGDIIISAAYVKRTAAAFDRAFDEHLTALIIHGIAHLLGYDHERDADFKQMERFEKKLLSVK